MTTTSNSSASSTTPPNSKSGSMKRTGTLSITREIEESVQSIIGSHVSLVYLTKALRLELKPEKYDTRLIVFTPYRLFLFTTKGTIKLEHSYNYVEISSIESPTPIRLVLGLQNDTRHFTFQAADSLVPGQAEQIVSTVIAQLVTPLKEIFPHVPLESFVKRIELEPQARWNDLNERLQELDERSRLRMCEPHQLASSPCGGFAQQYGCFCDYFGVAFQEEVAWDVNNIHASVVANAELSFVDFEHLEAKDLVPLVAALTYNTYFTKFRVSNVKIGSSSGGSHSSSEQLLDQIVNLVKRSSTLEEIYFDNIGVRAEFVNKLCNALLANGANTAVRVIDLSGNVLEDKGLKGLSTFIAKSFHAAAAGSASMDNSTDDLNSSLNFSSNSQQQQTTLSSSSSLGKTSSAKLMYKGFAHLNLARCALTAKGVSELSEALYLNKSMFSTLTYLNLGDNNLKDDISKLYNFLAQPNNLVHLDLSGSDCNLESVFGALLYGCTNKLVHLNLARNQFTSAKKSSKDLVVPVSIKKFFSTAIFLRTVNLSQNRLPPEALKAILLGLACNESAADIRLNLAANDFKEKGAAVLELALTDIRCVSGLDLSDNSLDMELVGVIGAISKNKAIKHLSIGKNFNNIKAKHIPKVLDAFAQMLQDEHCSLESLQLIDSKLRNETSLVLNALGSNQSLIKIDVSGNLMGLNGAKTLAKALQVNTRLETIYLDRNQITTNGFIDIAYAFERNFTLKHLPTPVQDVHQAMLKLPERTEAAITKIQECIRRNNLPHASFMRSMRSMTVGSTSAAAAAAVPSANFALDQGLASMIDRTSQQLAQAVRGACGGGKVLTGSNRIPSVDSIDLNLDGGGEVMIDGSIPSESLLRAEYLLRDVANIRGLVSRMQELYTQTSSAVVGANAASSDNLGRPMINSHFAISRPIEADIFEFAKQLRRTFEVQILSISERIIAHVKDEFPQVFSQNAHLENELKELIVMVINNNSHNGSPSVPSIEYFHMCLTDAATGIASSVRLEAILEDIAARVCNRVLLELSRCLVVAHKTITGGGRGMFDARSGDMILALDGQRSLTPEILMAAGGGGGGPRIWHDANDLSEADIDGNALATPKMQTQAVKKQNVYIRKPRPQSVMDGAMQSQDVDLSSSKTTNGFNVSSVAPSVGRVQHLTKSRPRAPKTRQATRVTIVDPNTHKTTTPLDPSLGRMDEGLDDFFPSLKMINNNDNSNDSLDMLIEPTLATISSTSSPVSASSIGLYGSSAKPQPQPRKILRKFGFAKSTDQAPEMLSHLSTPSQHHHQHVNLKNEDFLGPRSVSPNAFIYSQNASSKKPSETSHVSICAAEPVDLLAEVQQTRMVSPVPGSKAEVQQHNELLAEIKTKHERRTHLSGDQLGGESAKERNVSGENAANMSVAKRATMFGGLYKSPSKSSINQSAGSEDVCSSPIASNGNHSNGSNGVSTTTTTTSGYHPPIKQRPKSIVGMLSGKFEMSINSSAK